MLSPTRDTAPTPITITTFGLSPDISDNILSLSTNPTTHLSPYKQYSSQPSPRTNIPFHLINPMIQDTLQISIIILWQSSEPTQKRKEDMEELRILLTDNINNDFCPTPMKDGKNRFEVEIVGSTSWGGEVDTSTDVDFTIVDRALPRGYEPKLWIQSPNSHSATLSKSEARHSRYYHIEENGLPGCYSLKYLSDCLQRIGMKHIVRSPQALPLLKFVDSERKLGCDLQCNDLSGIYNCSLILQYCLISPYILRPMINIIKKWYKVISGKDPKTGNKINKFKLSSYCLSLICISYLQHIEHLPNLQEDIPNKIYNTEEELWNDKELIWIDWGRLKGLPSHTSFSKLPKNYWKCLNSDLTVGEAIRGFFNYFSSSPFSHTPNQDIKADNIGMKDKFHSTKYIISPLNGGMIPRSAPFKDNSFEELQNDQITYLKYKGYPNEQIKLIMEEWISSKSIEIEMKMSKGNKGLQPFKWSINRLVVQDPFKWTKNHAESMNEDICNDLFKCIDEAQAILKKLGTEVKVQDILDIRRYHRGPPSAIDL